MRSTNYAHTSFRIHAFTRTVEIANEISIHGSYAAVESNTLIIYTICSEIPHRTLEIYGLSIAKNLIYPICQ